MINLQAIPNKLGSSVKMGDGMVVLFYEIATGRKEPDLDKKYSGPHLHESWSLYHWVQAYSLIVGRSPTREQCRQMADSHYATILDGIEF